MAAHAEQQTVLDPVIWASVISVTEGFD